MKLSFLLFALLLSGSVHLVCGQIQHPALAANGSAIFSTYPKLEAQAKEYGDSFVRKDFEGLLQLTWPKYVEKQGRESLSAGFALTLKELEAHGAQLVSWTPSEGRQLLEHAGLLYAVVPTTMRFKVGEQSSESAVCLIAVSTDQGEHWTFISVSCICPKEAFPEIADKLVLCPQSN
jgi:hypothetical protein